MAEKQKKTILTVKQKSSELENFRMGDLQQNQVNIWNRNTKHMTKEQQNDISETCKNCYCGAQPSKHKIREMSGLEKVDADLLQRFKQKQDHQFLLLCVHRRPHRFTRLLDWNVSSMSPLNG